MNKLFFIVGIGRSGTTLLQSMLNSHPQIACPPESHFITKFIVDEINGDLYSQNPRTVLEQLKNDDFVTRLQVNLDTIFQPYINGSKQFSYREVFIDALTHYSHKVDKPIIGEKDPSNTPYLTEIFYAYPESAVIHIIRDPRDVVLSKIKTEWGKNTSFWIHLSDCKRNLPLARKTGIRFFGRQYLEIFYEDLIVDPKNELSKICQFLGVEFDNEMLNYQIHSNQIVTTDELPWKKNVFNPLIKDNTQKWRQQLSRSKTLAIEGACNDTMKELGYEFSGYGGPLKRTVFGSPLSGVMLAAFIKQALKRLKYWGKMI